jgi:tetratricopeptide (TPR) repeat protein
MLPRMFPLRLSIAILFAWLAGSAPAAHAASNGAAKRGGAPAVREFVPADEFDAGQMHFARGEYRLAADAFARAGARLDPARKPGARYWSGLSWLGANDPVQARSAFEDVIASSPPLRPFATLGLAQSWDLARRPDRVLDVLSQLLASGSGEAMPAALARFAELAGAKGRAQDAKRAEERLQRDWPSSMEASALRLATAPRAPGARANTTAEDAPARTH